MAAGGASFPVVDLTRSSGSTFPVVLGSKRRLARGDIIASAFVDDDDVVVVAVLGNRGASTAVDDDDGADDAAVTTNGAIVRRCNCVASGVSARSCAVSRSSIASAKNGDVPDWNDDSSISSTAAVVSPPLPPPSSRGR